MLEATQIILPTQAKSGGSMIQISNAKDLGLLLKQRRQEEGLTKFDLAGLTNNSERFISDLELGKGTIHFDKIVRIMAALGLVFGVSEKEFTPFPMPTPDPNNLERDCYFAGKGD